MTLQEQVARMICCKDGVCRANYAGLRCTSTDFDFTALTIIALVQEDCAQICDDRWAGHMKAAEVVHEMDVPVEESVKCSALAKEAEACATAIRSRK